MAVFRPASGARRQPSQVDGEQYVALAMGPELWAFKLGGTVEPQEAPPMSAGRRSAGRVVDEIQTTTLVQSTERRVGLRYIVDEHAFNPSKASVKAGTIVTFVKSGMMTHTVSAHDASWSTGRLKLAESGYVRFDEPGVYTTTARITPGPWGRSRWRPDGWMIDTRDEEECLMSLKPVEWIGGATAAFGLTIYILILGVSLMPGRMEAAEVGNFFPWLMTWGMIFGAAVNRTTGGWFPRRVRDG